jgi:hypothetical protein
MEKTRTTPAKKRKKPAAEGLSEGRGSAAPVLLNVYLWDAEGNDIPPLAVAMVGDLLASSPCELHGPSTSSVAASFPDAAQAVAAARRLGRLCRGFSRNVQSGQLEGCFFLCNLAEDQPGFESQWVERLPLMARQNNGQILLLGDLCQSAGSIPGLQFEAVFGLWVPPGADRRSLLKLMPPTQMEGYVDEPIEVRTPSVKAATGPASTQASPPILPVAQVPVSVPVSGVAPSLQADHPQTTGAEMAGFSPVESAPKRQFPTRWVAMGGAAAMAVAAAAVLLQHPGRPGTPQQLVVPAASPTPATVNPAPPSTAPVLQPASAGTGKKKPADTGHDQPGDQTVAAPVPTKKEAGEGTNLPFLSEEISRSLAIAEKEVGDGKYDEAISTYNIILRKDPGNAQAISGRNKAIRNKGHR